MTLHPLLSFVSDSLTAFGGIVDPEEGAQQLHCLLPKALAEQLALTDEASLSLPSGQGTPVIYGESLLDSLLEWIQGNGRLAHIEIRELSTQSGGMKGLLQRSIQLHNAVGEVRSISATSCTYFLLFYRYQARCKESSTGDFRVLALNEFSLAPTPWLFDHLEARNLAFKESPPPPFHSSFDAILEQLHLGIEQQVKQHLDPFIQSVEHQISRLRRRLERQHRRERKEILGPLLKDSSLDPTEALEALEAAEAAYVEALRPLPEQFPIDVFLEPFAALRVTLPVTRVDYHIRRRKEERTIHWLWNPLTEAIESRLCEACSEPTYHLSANDALKLLCRSCAD